MWTYFKIKDTVTKYLCKGLNIMGWKDNIGKCALIASPHKRFAHIGFTVFVMCVCYELNVSCGWAEPHHYRQTFVNPNIKIGQLKRLVFRFTYDRALQKFDLFMRA